MRLIAFLNCYAKIFSSWVNQHVIAVGNLDGEVDLPGWRRNKIAHLFHSLQGPLDQNEFWLNLVTNSSAILLETYYDEGCIRKTFSSQSLNQSVVTRRRSGMWLILDLKSHRRLLIKDLNSFNFWNNSFQLNYSPDITSSSSSYSYDEQSPVCMSVWVGTRSISISRLFWCLPVFHLQHHHQFRMVIHYSLMSLHHHPLLFAFRLAIYNFILIDYS